MNSINIYWIEDNPIQDDILIKDGVKYPSFKISGGQGLFSFKLFQHPLEVREYLSMIEAINNQGLAKNLGEKCCRAIPDIIVFDYKLSDNFTTSNPSALQYNRHGQASFLREHSASLELKECFKKEFSERELFIERADVIEGNYNSDEFQSALGIDVFTLDDEFGLFAGIAVVREFKDYITLGIPATFNKADKKAMSQNSLFYEWLNSYDIEDAIQRPDKGSKNWDDILKFALPLLRKRIETQIRTGKVTPHYYQLINLSNGTSEDNIISFTSAYGERHLPLDGLFLDKKQTVEDWASGLIDSLPTSSEVIAKAVKVSDHLWDIYCKKFVDRIDLSDYKFRETRGGLDAEEKKKFETLKQTYCEGEKFKMEFSVQQSFEHLTEDTSTVRLTVLHLAARAEIEMSKCSKAAPNSPSYSELSKPERFNVLFPFYDLIGETGSLLLPMHAMSAWTKLSDRGRKWLADNLNLNNDSVKVTRSNCLDFKKWITAGEKILLRAIYYQDKDFYPKWFN